MTTEPTAIHVEVLPARLGDCLLVECPRPAGPTWRMLVDGGPPDTWPLLEARLRRLDPADRHIDVAVITHIDNDHIGGMLAFLSSDLAADVGDFWFNGRTHLPSAPGVARSIDQGEERRRRAARPGDPSSRCVSRRRRLGARRRRRPAVERGLRRRAHRHGRLTGGHLEVAVPDGPTITVALPHDRAPGAARRLVVRRPRRRPCTAPLARWAVDVLGPLDDLQHLADERTVRDASVPNGSSIALLVEHRGASVLLGADAYGTVLASGSARPGAGPRRSDPGRRRAQAAPPRQPGQRRRGPARGGAGQPLPRLHQRRRLPPPRRRRDGPRRARRADRVLPVVQLPHPAHRAVGRPASHRAARLPRHLPRPGARDAGIVLDLPARR